MTWKHYLAITCLGVLILAAGVVFQHAPGYMDAEYYYSMGLRIANGKGFSEPFVWNYLADVEGVPHAGFTYWMPMPAFLTALGVWITRTGTFASGRFFHLVLAAFIPALSMAAAWKMEGNRSAALLAGLLSILPVFYSVFMGTTDSFAITMLLGGVIYLLSRKPELPGNMIGIGVAAGLMHLTRADGLIWIAVGIYCAWRRPEKKGAAVLYVFGGYLLVMGPWFFRNLQALGQVLPSGTSRAFWMREYNDLFTYRPDDLSYQNWINQGIHKILNDYLDAGVANLRTALLVQGQIILVPFVLLGGWRHRQDLGLQGIFLVWLGIFMAMSVVFPFAGMRGGYLHSGAAFQTIIWGLAASGFFVVMDWGVKKRDWNRSKAGFVFGSALLVLVGLAAVFVHRDRVIGSDKYDSRWDRSFQEAKNISSYLDGLGVLEEELVLINNPPGFYAASGRHSIVVPDDGLEAVLEAAGEFGARYLVLEENHPPALNELYSHPGSEARLEVAGRVGPAIIFRIKE